MVASHKAALKAAKVALDASKFETAVEEAAKVLQNEPSHYHANVFQGLAFDKQGKQEASEEAYKRAIKTKDDDSLAWQGLVSLYQQQANKKIDEYATAARQLADIYMRIEDITRCQTVVDKYVEFTKQYGTKTQYLHALEFMLPTSPIYDYLEGRLPHPGITYPRITEIVETEEKQRINRLIGERKTRLGARVGQVTNEVKREIFADSSLESLCDQVINWTREDDIRRLYEEKLLQRAYDTLIVLPRDEKEAKITQVRDLARGIVILKHPFHLAWKIVLEWKDVEYLQDLDLNLLTQYLELFPSDGFSKVVSGYLSSPASPFQKIGEKDGTTNGNLDSETGIDQTKQSEEELLMVMTDGLEESSRSVLSQRIMAEYYNYLEEFASAVEVARKARDLIETEEQSTGLILRNCADAVEIALGTALVHYQAPRHHDEARRLFEGVLSRKPENAAALIGIGLIFEEEEDYYSAAEFLTKTLSNSPSNKIKAEAAWCTTLGGDLVAGADRIQECLDEIDKQPCDDKAFKAQCMYRLGICKWKLDTSKAARKNRKGAYSYFLEALQLNLNYAPAYTSLGIYYTDYGKDQKRARKCFQKALELSSSEVEAAERLARSFADQGEWDLVEVVAQRVIDSGKTRLPPGSKRKGLSWPYSALGICQINNLDYVKSIASFQAALRLEPNDAHSWIGLGESYHNSGRYISAIKAFEQVHQLSDANTSVEDFVWFSRYMLANVHRELGEFEESINGLTEALSIKPGDFGASLALLQTHVEAGSHNVEIGLFGRAAIDCSHAIEAAATVVTDHSSAFNLWKAVADACLIFTLIGAWSEEMPKSKILTILNTEAKKNHYGALADIDHISIESISALEESPAGSLAAHIAAILSNKRAIHCASHDAHAQAVAWYNLGLSEYRAHSCFDLVSSKALRSDISHYLKAAVKCFKRAIELEPGNSEFWNALGIATTSLNPKVAQHSFCRSLYLNGNLARVWTNLGVFYLLQNDVELASKTFTRGQSADPDYGPAWLGQGLLSLLAGETKEAHNQFTHAFEVSDSLSVVGNRLYAFSTFDLMLNTSGSERSASHLLEPLFALHQLRCQEPRNIVYHHLSSLMAEHVSGIYGSFEDLRSICDELESCYDASEAESDLVRFVQAKADLARSRLSHGEFSAAFKDALTAVDLSDDSDLKQMHREKLNKARLSAHLTAGVACHHLNKDSEAITMFRAALVESDSNPDVICRLAQVLWATGGEGERQASREQLLTCVEENPNHAGTITLLSVIAILDDDMETLEAVSSDLHGLRSRLDVGEKEKFGVGKILSAAAAIRSDGSDAFADVLTEALTSILLAPAQPHGWAQLSDLCDGNEPYPNEVGVLAACVSVPPRGTLGADDLARAYAGTARPSDAQRAIITAPWVTSGWDSLR